MKLFWTEPAIQDLRDLRDYIAADSDFHAADFIGNLWGQEPKPWETA